MKLQKLIFAGFLCFAGRLWAQDPPIDRQTFENSTTWQKTQYCPNECNTYADWTIVSSGSYPSASPYQGTGMLKFNSRDADSGAEARLASGALDMTGADVAEVRFWMFHSTGDSTNDLVKVQASTDGGNIYWGIKFFRRNDGTSGWQEHVVPLGQYTDQSALRLALRGQSGNGLNFFIDDLRIYKQTLPPGAEGKACSAPAECNSGICSPDPSGQGRCRENLSGHDCISGDRIAVAAGTVTCFRGDKATCNSNHSWSVESCFDDCGPYVDVHACEYGQCAACPYSNCFTLTGEGCDQNAYCETIFGFLGECKYKKADGASCSKNIECLSNNCASSPSGSSFCAPLGSCAAVDGTPVASGQKTCYAGDLYTCSNGLWQGSDCYNNCGFYLDVDDCQNNACVACATSCTSNSQCKPGILCTNNQCVGNLPNGQTCTSDAQCASGHCLDGVCCADICTALCHRCNLSGTAGTCSPIPAGQDPDGECSGQGLCAGSCNGQGACQWPGQNTICDVCARCDGAGHCNRYVAAGADPQNECPTCTVCKGNAPGCTPVPAGQDPLDECPAQSAESCGTDGACDGAGACRLWPNGTLCGASSCSEGLLQLADRCDGQGRCTDGGSQSCGLFRCADASSCAASCISHSQCVLQAFCDSSGKCSADLGDGASCENLVWPGLEANSACLGGWCRRDNFDGSGAFCTSDPTGCVHDGSFFPAGYVLCLDASGFRRCLGGSSGWGEFTSCSTGTCDAGGGPGSGYRQSSGCTSGSDGGCQGLCQGCEPYLARTDGTGCLASCTQDNQCWPGYRCRDGSCRLPEGIGSPCQNQSQCPVGFCVDGVCCIEACVGPCRSCNQPGRAGRCLLFAAGTDPENECPAQSAESCGTTGTCDGQGACALHPAGTACSNAYCQGDVLVVAGSCNGAGDCIETKPVDCRPGRCRNASCSSSCTVHEDCSSEGFCATDGTCHAKLNDGENCAGVVYPGLDRHAACRGGFCREDGIDEGQAFCTSDELVCLARGEAYPPGYRLCGGENWYRTCLGGDNGWGPQTNCREAGFCDAGGGPASGVREPEKCTSGPEGGCRSECRSCAPYLARQAGVCPTDCNEYGDCWPGFFCSQGTCQPRPGIGDSCQDDTQCSGWYCRDGFCCNDDCQGPCRSCADPRLPGACLFSPYGTDREEDCSEEATECGLAEYCSGEGSCAFRPAGTTCQPASCANGIYQPPGACDGKGHCIQPPTYHCQSSVCQGDRCGPLEEPGTDGGDGSPDGGATDGAYEGPPIAEAGAPQVAKPAERVTLDGSASQGRQLVYSWEQSSGPASVALEGASTARPSFVAQREGVYVFRLVVSDGQRESLPDYTQVYVVSEAGGCGCASEDPSCGLWPSVLIALWLARRRTLILGLLLAVSAVGWSCNENITGRLSLLLTPPHQGRNPSEDPFQLADKLELGLIDSNGSCRVLGQVQPLALAAIGPLGGELNGWPYLQAYNARGRPVAQGYGPLINLQPGGHQLLSLALMKIDAALASRTTDLSQAPITLRLGRLQLEKGNLSGENDASLQLRAGWDENNLYFLARVTDDRVQPAGEAEPPGSGDAIKFYFAEGAVTVGADGRIEDGTGKATATAGAVGSGYTVELTLPAPGLQKNQAVKFDLRLLDRDADDVAWLTWQFDPRDGGDDPPPSRFGRLIAGAPLVEAMADAAAKTTFAVSEGLAEISAGWDRNILTFRITVPDNEIETSNDVEQGDRVRVLLDLANGMPPLAEPLRFFEYTISAGSLYRVRGGNHWPELEQNAPFSGSARGIQGAGSYLVEVEVPWEDLGLDKYGPQRGWFLGLEVEVVDADGEDERIFSLSGISEAAPEQWPELRLNSLNLKGTTP